jgi:adenosylhomocysteine nucleosidase
MLLIVAALQEELNIALSICEHPKKVRRKGVDFWQATRKSQMYHLLKTGIGPKRSAESLTHALEFLDVSQILVMGYAGALDPQLKIGALVVVKKALLCTIDATNPAVEQMKLDREFILAPSESLVRTSESLQLTVCRGDTLTSSHVWGNPQHKKVLLEKFGACIVDMETAALAGVSERADIPLRCIRVVSDEAEESFLEPFSYDPSAGVPQRAGRLIRKGNPVKTFRRWKRNASAARDRLGRFLWGYL